MACDTRLMHAHEKRVSVAVVGDFLDLLHVARSLPLAPELLARAAVEPCEACFQSFLQRFLIHVGEHENLAVFLLHDGGDKTFFVKMYHGNINRSIHNLTSTPRFFR